MTSSSLPTHARVVIVGGGMAGLSCAAALAKRGVSDVVLLEARTLAHAGASSYGETQRLQWHVVRQAANISLSFEALL